MNKWFMGFAASLACLFMLSAALVVILSVMNAVSFDAANLWKLPLCIPLAVGGALLLRWLDKKFGA